jgi:hypothetical protein
VRQLYDTALCAAGLIDDPRTMLAGMAEVLLDAATPVEAAKNE